LVHYFEIRYIIWKLLSLIYNELHQLRLGRVSGELEHHGVGVYELSDCFCWSLNRSQTRNSLPESVADSSLKNPGNFLGFGVIWIGTLNG
jgi:hypothetical protein